MLLHTGILGKGHLTIFNPRELFFYFKKSLLRANVTNMLKVFLARVARELVVYFNALQPLPPANTSFTKFVVRIFFCLWALKNVICRTSALPDGRSLQEKSAAELCFLGSFLLLLSLGHLSLSFFFKKCLHWCMTIIYTSRIHRDIYVPAHNTI